MQTKILLIDSNAIFCNGVKRLLEEHKIEVVATTNNSEEGVQLAKTLLPTFILLDMDLAQTGNMQVLKQLRTQQPHTRIALITWQTNSNQLNGVLKHGASGYLSRNIQPNDLISAIRNISIGNTVVPPELSPVLSRFRQAQASEPQQNSTADLIATLTPREYETLTYLTRGLNNKLIAREMNLTEGTVKIHVKGILSKLKVDTRINAAVLALEQGIGADST